MTFPLDPAALTPDWLASVLNFSVRHVEVEAVGRQSFVGETVRVKISYDPPDAKAPRTLIAKFPTKNPGRRDYFATMGMYEREVRFYEQIAPRLAIKTPGCFFSAYDESSGLGILLLEDFAPARSGSRLQGCTVEEAKRAIRAIAQLHIAWWRHPEIAELDWLHRYDPKSLQQRFLDTWEAFTQNVTAPVMAIGERLAGDFALLDTLWQAPLTLIHRDYQLDNIFFMGDTTAIIDWQLIAPGRGVFDVAMFLCWNSSPDFRRVNEVALLRDYHQTLLDGGVKDYSFDDCLRDYRLSLLQCLVRLVPIMGSGVVAEESLLKTLNILLERTTAALIDFWGD